VATYKCVECGKEVDEAMFLEEHLGVPLCEHCYRKARERFSESIPNPQEYNERCNLK